MVLFQATVNFVDKKGYTNSVDVKLFGEEAVQALMQEFAQLEDLGVFLSKQANELTRKQNVMP